MSIHAPKSGFHVRVCLSTLLAGLAATVSTAAASAAEAGGADRIAEAVGVKIALEDGTTIHAIVNHEAEGTEVLLGDLETRERFATDYATK